MIVESIRDQHSPVGKERDVLRFGEMRLVCAGDVLLAQGLQLLLTVIREHEDLIEALLHDPDAAFRIVRADTQAVRARTVEPPQITASHCGQRSFTLPLRSTE